MIRGLYTAAAGMIAEQRKHDTITNNIANLNTPGFKQGNTQFRSFPEMMLYLINGGAGEPPKPIGRIQNGVFAEENVIGFSQGDMQETKNPTDFAIVSNIQVQDNQQNNIPFDEKGQFVTPQGTVIYQPQAFFTVASEANPQEIKYTRNGSFQVNQAGYLVTSSGYRVLGVNGQPIVMDRQIGDIKVLPDGSFADPSNGQLIQDANGNDVKLFLSQIDNPNQLIPQGNGVCIEPCPIEESAGSC